MSRKTVAVVIPIYRTKLTDCEIISLKQCLRVLHNYPIFLILPDNISLGDLEKYKDKIKINQLISYHFKDVNSYSKLLISKKFYKQFLDYDYILIHQLDAFVFKDELNDWCNKNYDYIGSPWIDNPIWVKKAKPIWAWRNNFVGNGGFSLRKVSTFIRMLNFFPFNRFIFEWHAKNAQIHEDVFWSLYIPSLNPFFKLPDINTALKFSFESSPSKCFEMNNYQLPFGCHAWEKYEIEFWRKIFIKFGYTI